MNRTPVVLIHGAWFRRSSWDSWAQRFTAHGFAVHVPGWPGEGAPAADDRRGRDARRNLALDALIAHYEVFVRSLGSRPVLIGHSLGGLVVQHLVGVGLGRAAVAVAPWPGGVVRPVDAADVKAGLRMLVSDGAGGDEGFAQLTRSRFREAVANTVSEQEAARLFERHIVPAPLRLLAELGYVRDGDGPFRPARLTVDTADTTRGPLLLISGQEDRVVPDAVTRAVYKAYGDSSAVTDLKQFADRGHSLVVDSGWRTVADHVLAWLAANGIEAGASDA
ncbi:MAG: alpha/beta hydrolase [Catenulispora sp.]|nr:alpha/beta hydrolase [Catenulispora sp.]